jgi:hypothetical protein
MEPMGNKKSLFGDVKASKGNLKADGLNSEFGKSIKKKEVPRQGKALLCF